MTKRDQETLKKLRAFVRTRDTAFSSVFTMNEQRKRWINALTRVLQKDKQRPTEI